MNNTHDKQCYTRNSPIYSFGEHRRSSEPTIIGIIAADVFPPSCNPPFWVGRYRQKMWGKLQFRPCAVSGSGHGVTQSCFLPTEAAHADWLNFLSLCLPWSLHSDITILYRIITRTEDFIHATEPHWVNTPANNVLKSIPSHAPVTTCRQSPCDRADDADW